MVTIEPNKGYLLCKKTLNKGQSVFKINADMSLEFVSGFEPKPNHIIEALKLARKLSLEGLETWTGTPNYISSRKALIGLKISHYESQIIKTKHTKTKS